MSPMAIGLGFSQAPSPGTLNVQVFETVEPDFLLPMTADAGIVVAGVFAPATHQGLYPLQSDLLSDAPVSVLAPQIEQTAENEPLRIAVPGLWACQDDGEAPTRSYRWQRNGVDISRATGPEYSPVAEDADQSLQLIETVTGPNGANSVVSNPVTVRVQQDVFAVRLTEGGLLEIVGNDGRIFDLDDPNDVYDGTYSAADLISGPVALDEAVLRVTTTPEAGQTLTIVPALFACDPALGTISVQYTTNGASVVDASDPSAPTVLVDPADAETTLVVTATASQGAGTAESVTNGIEISALPATFNVVLSDDGTLEIEGNDGRSFIIDDAENRYDGTYNVTAAALEAGAVPLVPPVLVGDENTAAGDRLAIVPALFAYDPEQGDLAVSYTTDATNDVDTRDPNNPTLLIDAADAGTTLSIAARGTQGANMAEANSNEVAIADALPVQAATPTFTLPPAAANYDNTSRASATMDLSAGSAGDTVVIHYGTDSASAPVALTVDGQVMTRIASAAAGANGNKTSGYLYELVLTSNGSEDAAIAVDLGASRSNGHIFVGAIVSGGTRVAADGAQTRTAERLSTSVAPSVSQNLVLSLCAGYSDRMNGNEDWIGTDAVGTRLTAFFGSTCASAEDVSVGPFTSALQIDGGAPSWQHGASMTTVAFDGV
ncbi:hypothetical protein [Tateyamaria sp. syn59]|uniref:hypothetical protein n=1 Tax=Tateyamaria sp. syn59 TaxID=2576942 RepID=UPI001CB8C321|nr:hypothetical protein [Tateyamaria sp. syn59]